MSTEPERDLEKTLRAYARTRREQAGEPLVMPAPTRALLQREAARLAPRPAAAPGWAQWLGNLWLRMGFASLVALGVLLWWSPWRAARMELAKSPPPGPQISFSRVAGETKPALAPAPAPAAEPPPGLEGNRPALKRDIVAVPALTAANSPGAAPSLGPQVTAGAAPASSARQQALPLAGSPPPAVDRNFDLAGRSETKKKALETDSSGANSTLLRDNLATAAPAPAADSSRFAAAGPDKSATNDSKGQPAGSTSLNAIGGFGGGFGGGRGGGGGGGLAPASPAPVVNGPAPIASTASPAAAGFRSEAGLGIAAAAGADRAAGDGVLWTPAPAPGPEPVNLPKFTAGSLAAGSASQQFAQAPVAAPGGRALKAVSADKSSPGAAVLQLFRMEQSGERLRVIDGDGSVYTGSIGKRDAPAAGPSFELAGKSLDAPAGPAPPPAYFFRVEGTNQSLNKVVRFSGNLVAAAEPGTGGRADFKDVAAGGTIRARAPAPAPFVWSRAQVQGRAKIGEAQEVPVNAFPVGK